MQKKVKKAKKTKSHHIERDEQQPGQRELNPVISKNPVMAFNPIHLI